MSTIPNIVLTPGVFVEFDGSRAFSGLPGQRHRVLLMGQRLPAGSADVGVPLRVTSAQQAETYYGRGSNLAAMVAAFKHANEYTETWAVALDDADAATEAEGSVTVTGPATGAGTLHLYVAGRRVAVGVASGDSADDIAAAVVEAINDNTELPVTAEVDAEDEHIVLLTARNAGEVGNCIDVRANYHQGELLPSGVGVEILNPTGGAGNPDVADVLAAIGDTQYLTIVTPWLDGANLTALETELAGRWEGMQANDGHAFAVRHGSFSEISQFVETRNSPHVTVLGHQNSPTPSYEFAAVLAAIDSREPDPGRPRQTLALPGVMAPSVGDRYTRPERNIHLQDGVSTFTVDDGGVCRIERLVTTYVTNPGGVTDIAYRDLVTIRNLSYQRFAVIAMFTNTYPRHKLAKDGTNFRAGQPVATPRLLRGSIIGLYQELELAGLVEDLAQFADDLVVQISQSDPNRVDVVLPPNLINQLRVIAARIEFRL